HRIAWVDGQQTIPNLSLFAITPLRLISQSQLLQKEGVAGIQIKCLLEIVSRLVPMTFAAIHEAGILENLGIVGQRRSGNQQLATGISEVIKPIIVICRHSEVCFPRLRLETHSGLGCSMSQIKTSPPLRPNSL